MSVIRSSCWTFMRTTTRATPTAAPIVSKSSVTSSTSSVAESPFSSVAASSPSSAAKAATARAAQAEVRITGPAAA
jgi:hypothetical protein